MLPARRSSQQVLRFVECVTCVRVNSYVIFHDTVFCILRIDVRSHFIVAAPRADGENMVVRIDPGNGKMRRLNFMAGFLLAMSSCGNIQAQDCCSDCGDCQPFLRFLDDLRCFPHATCLRDPYEERIETERHDFTQSTKTVGRGVVQVEAGYSYFYKDEDDETEHSHTTPEAMLRLGLSDDIEFRLRWTYGWRFIDVAAAMPTLTSSCKPSMPTRCSPIPR